MHGCLMYFLQITGTNREFSSPPYLNPNLFEGDIIGIRNVSRQNRNVVNQENTWPMGKIPYMIKNRLADELMLLIRKAILHYEKYTCIRFVFRTYEVDFVLIFEGSGCYSYVGKKGGEQSLSLDRRCGHFPIIVHEFGHLIGLHHEHNRVDRDDYLLIHWENMKKGMKKQFIKVNRSNADTTEKFDYKSIMLYGENAFSKDGISKTMEAKNGMHLEQLEEKSGLSTSDRFKINKLYKCRD
nr:astacin-like metallopeptidase 2 isoform X1 [Hottentotta saulcyi]